MRFGMLLFSPVRDFRQERLSCGKNPAKTPLIYIRNIQEEKPEKKSLGKTESLARQALKGCLKTVPVNA